MLVSYKLLRQSRVNHKQPYYTEEGLWVHLKKDINNF